MVDLSLLVKKLNNYQVKGNLLKWLVSFLSGREQRVRVSNSLSSPREVRSGVPQGSVLGPILFLAYISDLQMTNPETFSLLLKFVDDSKVLTRTSTEEDVLKLQEDLTQVYRWASDNHMSWNDLKFQVLRLGPNQELKDNTIIFSPDYGEVVEQKSSIKDLGILVDDSLSYGDQLSRAVSKATPKSSWVLRTFSTRKVEFMRTMWQSLIQCHLDYGCLLWAPYSTKTKLKILEDPLRAFTRRGEGMFHLPYWERLQSFKLSSSQRRVERYRIIYSWKSLNGLAPSLGLTWSEHSVGRSGRVLRVPRVEGVTSRCKSLRRDTIQHEGVKLLNIIPKEIRNFCGKQEEFKRLLDSYLTLIPDQPATETLTPGVTDIEGIPSNSIYDWIRARAPNWNPCVTLLYCEERQTYSICQSSVGGGSAKPLIV